MGTVVSFDIPAAARHDGSLDAAVGWLHWVDRVFSAYRPDSDVSLLADGAVTVEDCVPEMTEVIDACAFVAELSGGYFTDRPSGRFDPTGFVKGWAVERAAAILSAAGSASHLVNGGGDVQCAGGRPASGAAEAGAPQAGADPVPGAAALPGAASGLRTVPWRVGIADPFRPGRLALVLDAADCGVATSGTAERGPHIVNPLAGRPARGLASLTVTGPSLALADAFATAAFAMGPDLAREWTEALDGYDAFAITEAGLTWQTSGFAARIAPPEPPG
jgi:FAD:protein FMN transferase